MTLSLSNVTPRDWRRVCLYLRRSWSREFRAEQRRVKADVLHQGKARQRILDGIERRSKPRATTFNDWCSSSYREQNAKAISEAMKGAA